MSEKDISAPGENPGLPNEGRITAIETQQKDASRVSIYIESTFAFGTSAEIAVREGLHVGRVLSAAEQSRIQAEERMGQARLRALNYISQRPRTAMQVRQKLLRDEFDEDVCDAVVHRLRELGYVDDRALAYRYAETRLSRRYGPIRVVQELRRRGIAPALAEEAVDAAGDDVLVLEGAIGAARSRLPRLHAEADPRKRKKKLYDFLMRRGYAADVIWKTIGQLEADSEW